MRLKRDHQDSIVECAEKQTTGPSIRSGALLMGAAQVTKRGFRLVALLIAARVLGPAELGVYTVLVTVTELVAIFSGTGYTEYVTREVSRNRDRVGSLLSKLIVLRVGYLALGVVTAVAALWGFGYSRQIVTCTALFAIALLPRLVAELAQGVIRGHQKFAALLAIEFAQGFALVTAVIAFVWQVRSVTTFVLAEIVSAAAGALVAGAIGVSLAHWRRGSNVESVGSLARTTFAFNIYPLIVNIYDRADVLLLSRLASNTAVGLYSLPYRVFATLQIVPYAMMGALLPKLSQAAWNDESERQCLAVARGLYALALLGILAAMLLSRPVVLLVMGPSYSGADLAFRILVWALVPVYFNSILNTVLLTLNRERVFLLTASICTLTNILANVMLIPHYGYIAAAGVTVATECVLLIQNIWFVRNSLGYLPLPSGIVPITFVFGLLYSIGRFLLMQGGSPWLAAALVVISFILYVSRRGDVAWAVLPRRVSVAEIEVRS